MRRYVSTSGLFRTLGIYEYPYVRLCDMAKHSYDRLGGITGSYYRAVCTTECITLVFSSSLLLHPGQVVLVSLLKETSTQSTRLCRGVPVLVCIAQRAVFTAKY